jgi:hypothetical protein
MLKIGETRRRYCRFVLLALPLTGYAYDIATRTGVFRQHFLVYITNWGQTVIVIANLVALVDVGSEYRKRNNDR